MTNTLAYLPKLKASLSQKNLTRHDYVFFGSKASTLPIQLHWNASGQKGCNTDVHEDFS